jgi:LmbE family N-acetylglucosaminyl deacetylase
MTGISMKQRLLAFLFMLAWAMPAPVLGAQRLPEDRGLSGLRQALDRLDVFSSVLHTGAHPDDEDSSLLAWLSRGQGARTAYLSTTRGEGGQNLIGNELFEGLGVIRTDELLAARRYDRGDQFFTPNFEFGYSKTARETLEKWGREALVGDFVRVIRHYRPEILISRFTGTPSDGHGHHQAAGIATIEAFRAAADLDLYPESEYGPAWQVKKLYMSGGGAAGIVVNVGEYGAAIGRSYHQIAMEGRSLHRTQSMGAAQDPGARTTSLRLVESTVDGGEDSLFAGTTATLMDLAGLEPPLAEDLASLQAAIDAVRESAGLEDPWAVLPGLIGILADFEAIRGKATVEHVRFLLDRKEPDFHEAAELAAGIRVDARVDDDVVVPGQTFTVTVVVTNDGPYDFPGFRATVNLPEGWSMDPVAASTGPSSGETVEARFEVTVGESPPFTQPYWLEAPREGDRFVWPATAAAMKPFSDPLLPVDVELSREGDPAGIEIPRHAQYRFVDEVLGERRRLVQVTPAVSVRMSPEVAVVPRSGRRTKEFTVTVRNQQEGGGTAEVMLDVPEGWTVSPPSATVEFTIEDQILTVPFTVALPDVDGRFEVATRVVMDGQTYDQGYRMIAYPHIETRHIYSDAVSEVRVFDLESRVENVGYVAGAGDEVAEALGQLGIPVTFLTPDDLARGDLGAYDTIVLGIRAYAVREDLRSYNQRLLDYVAAGGTLVVQYNTYPILDRQFGPYPFTINRPHDRVTVEDAPVTFIDPDHPVLNTPNRLGPADFDGWVQERGLYFLGDFDARYTPVLASNDPGEEPKTGGLVVAGFGEGRYVYTGYAFFRQLPAGVAGAYRLFANVISLGN